MCEQRAQWDDFTAHVDIGNHRSALVAAMNLLCLILWNGYEVLTLQASYGVYIFRDEARGIRITSGVPRVILPKWINREKEGLLPKTLVQ
jgi:hypothetical protein